LTIVQNAFLCGIIGAVSSHMTYVRSNLFILGDVTRRGRHVLWDPAFFDSVGLVWGVLVGAACAARFFSASPLKATLLGVGLTLAGVGVAGGASTISRYRALPHEPAIGGKRITLEFEMRLPAARDSAGELPTRGYVDDGGRKPRDFVLLRQAMRISDGRIVLPGSIVLLHASSPRLLSFDDSDGISANFMLPLAATPTQADTAWTDWTPAVNSEAGLPPTQVFEIRYRIRFE
jgi:hypothetical protein